MPCAHPKPFPPAAALALASTFCLGAGLLLAGLLQPDHPLPPIRTAGDQTPVSMTLPTSIATGFAPNSAKPPSPPFRDVATPKSSFYVGVRSYALLSACGTYKVEVPNQPGMVASSSIQPVPNCPME